MQAPLEKQKFGLSPATKGWFALNLADAAWHANEEYGCWAGLRAQERDEQPGVNGPHCRMLAIPCLGGLSFGLISMWIWCGRACTARHRS